MQVKPENVTKFKIGTKKDGRIGALLRGMRFAQPDSGTNHGTAMSAIVAEMLGFTSMDRIRLIWGDSDLAPSSPGWHSGLTTMLQGGALCSAADKLRTDLLKRAADTLKTEVAKLQMRNGAISSTENPKRSTTFAALARGQQRCHVPEQTQVFIDSLEPRWFYGIKGVAETTIGAVPGAIYNAIYNACGVRIREHPITREKIMAGLKARGIRS